MSDMDAKPFPRPCVISSHQFHIEGLCLLITTDGHAVVELGRGDVSRYPLHPAGLYSIKFLDRDADKT